MYKENILVTDTMSQMEGLMWPPHKHSFYIEEF